MSLFGKLVKTAVNTALLPVAIIKDIATAPLYVIDNQPVGTATKKAIETLKEEADD